MRALAQALTAAFLIAFFATAGERPLFAAELTVESYCTISVERLQLAVSVLEAQGRSLTDEDEKTLWAQHGTTRDTFYGYAGAHSEDVSSYLVAHPELEATINALSRRLRVLVEQTDPAPTDTGSP